MGVDVDCHICVMGWLSVTMTTLFPPHEFPQVKTAAKIAKSSRQSISASAHDGGQEDCIQALL